MSAPFSGLEGLFDVFFNGRPANRQPDTPKPEPIKVTLSELVRRRSSVMRLDGRLYRVTVTEIEVVR